MAGRNWNGSMEHVRNVSELCVAHFHWNCAGRSGWSREKRNQEAHTERDDGQQLADIARNDASHWRGDRSSWNDFSPRAMNVDLVWLRTHRMNDFASFGWFICAASECECVRCRFMRQHRCYSNINVLCIISVSNKRIHGKRINWTGNRAAVLTMFV